MDVSQLPAEDKQFLARLADLHSLCEKGQAPRFSPFCNEWQAQLGAEYLRRLPGEHTLWFGGYPGATRKMLGFFPSWQEPEEEAFPIAAVTLDLPRDAALHHRDYLGSLMSLHIARESIGDIIPHVGCCTLFVAGAVAPVILAELTKVGGTGVRPRPGMEGFVPPVQQYQPIKGTVASLRLDSLVHLLTGLSREKSGGLIRGGLVQQNYRVCESLSQGVGPGDVITIRGYGKFRLEEVGSPTKKGRLPLTCLKYA